MKKSRIYIVAIVIVAASVQTASAQEPYLKSGKFLIQGNVGYGGGAFIAVGAGFPIVPQVNLEYIAVENAFGEGSGAIGVGAVAALGLYSVGSANVTSFVAGVQGNYHFTPKAQFDPYIGLMLGFYTYSLNLGLSQFGINETFSGFGWSGHVGATYWLSNGFGLHGRLGYGVAIVSLGLTLGL